MTKRSAPHHFHSDLSPERLAFIVQVIRACRTQAYDAHVGLDDVEWASQCLAYKLTLNKFRKLAKVVVPWLSFWSEEELAYFIGVGVVPVRLQRSDRPMKPRMITEGRLANATQTLLPFGDGRQKLGDVLVRFEFRVDGPQIGLCELVVYSNDGKVAYGRWLVDELDSAVPLVMHEADDIPPADFDLGEEEEEDGETEPG